ncbi:Hemicentin-1 [Desmophyllum pertusum]|uniref:Hemicentin-1 n=1 Tax=Desmophyllum pertusum TaxID=174260 RepID=A0A9X0CPE6_9CNID|nr:Hemicentin-1 [Desmophyllum pertusum]
MSTESYYCDVRSCPVDGNWAQWGRWSPCSARCSGGTQRRYRYCSNPHPSSGGKECPGDRVEIVRCNTKPCRGKVSLYKAFDYNSNQLIKEREVRGRWRKGPMP